MKIIAQVLVHFVQQITLTLDLPVKVVLHFSRNAHDDKCSVPLKLWFE